MTTTIAASTTTTAAKLAAALTATRHATEADDRFGLAHDHIYLAAGDGHLIAVATDRYVVTYARIPVSSEALPPVLLHRQHAHVILQALAGLAPTTNVRLRADYEGNGGHVPAGPRALIVDIDEDVSIRATTGPVTAWPVDSVRKLLDHPTMPAQPGQYVLTTTILDRLARIGRDGVRVLDPSDPAGTMRMTMLLPNDTPSWSSSRPRTPLRADIGGWLVVLAVAGPPEPGTAGVDVIWPEATS